MDKLKPEYSISFKYLLQMLSSVLLNKQPPKPYKETDWALVFHCAKKHSVIGMLSYAVQKLEPEYRPAPELMKELLELKHSELILESNIQFETDKLMASLANENLNVVLLKGMILKNYYPIPSMRTMSDVDVLYELKDKSEIKRVFKEQGYRLELDNADELHLRKEPFHYYEMHAYLFPQHCDSHEFFLSAWNNLQQGSENNYKTLNLEFTYLYMLEHLARHIEKAGAGLRLIMDVFVFLRKEKDNFDTEVVNKGLEILRLKDFEERITVLADSWFLSDNPDTDSLSAGYILSSSTFGLADNAVLQSNIRVERKKGKKQNRVNVLLRSVFPDYQQICARFSSARKLKCLYPFYIPAYWCLRLFKDRNVRTSSIKKYFSKTDSGKAEYLVSVMDEIGLSSRM